MKHSVAGLFLFISFTWFGVTFVQNYSEVAALKQSLTSVADNNITLARALFNITAAEGYGGNRITTVINSFLPYLSAAYLIVLLVLLVKLTRAYIFSIQLKTRGLIELDEQWIRFVNKYALSIGVGRKVKVFLSEKIDVPATLDFFKPVILLPVATFNHLTVSQVESVLLHELAHIRRHDYLVNIVASVIETVLFFNPFVHLLTRSLKKEREHCCDDLVLRYKFDPHSYASALLSLEKMRVGMQPLAVAATGESGQLLGRVKRIMNVKSTNFNYGQKLTALVVTALILLSLAWLSPSPSSDQNINNAQATVQHIEEKEVYITKDPAASLPRLSQAPEEAYVQKTENLKVIRDKADIIANSMAVDSIFPGVPVSSVVAPPAPPAAPSFPRFPEGTDTTNGITYMPGYLEAFPEQYRQYNIEAPGHIDLLMDNEEWKKAQKDMEGGYSVNLDALDENLRFMIMDNAKKLNDVFEKDQKRLVAEKYLQQLLQKDLNQKELQLARQQLFADQKLQLNNAFKTKKKTDSTRVKLNRVKAAQKAIWINDHMLPEKVNRELKKLHLDTESPVKMAYAVNVDINAVCETVNKIATVASITASEARDFSFDYQNNSTGTDYTGNKRTKTVTICSDKNNSSIVISFVE